MNEKTEAHIVDANKPAISAAAIERFWKFVDKNGPTQPHCPELGPCWIWRGYLNNGGYGSWVADCATMKKLLTHRVAWRLAHGKWPEPCALHKCDNRACVNPEHLFEGTLAENCHDRHRKGRTINGSVSGERNAQSKLTEEQVREIRRCCEHGESCLVLAPRFGVSPVLIRLIARRKAWKHVA